MLHILSIETVNREHDSCHLFLQGLSLPGPWEPFEVHEDVLLYHFGFSSPDSFKLILPTKLGALRDRRVGESTDIIKSLGYFKNVQNKAKKMSGSVVVLGDGEITDHGLQTISHYP